MEEDQARKLVYAPPIHRREEPLKTWNTENHGDIIRGKHGELMRTMLEYQGFVNDSKKSFDTWITSSLPKQITSQAIDMGDGSYVRFKEPSIYPPTFKTPEGEEKLLPATARAISMTYAIDLYAKIEQIKDGKVIRPLPNEPDEPIALCSIPLMLGSKYCWLRNMTPKEKLVAGECHRDPLGYFVIKGHEKLLLLREQLRTSKPLVFLNKDKKPVCRITSWTISGTTIVEMGQDSKDKSIRLYLFYLGDRRDKKGSICVLQAMRILLELAGNPHTGSAHSLIQSILLFTKPEWRNRVARELYMSEAFTDNVHDDIAYIRKMRGEDAPEKPTADQLRRKLLEVTGWISQVNEYLKNNQPNNLRQYAMNMAVKAKELEAQGKTKEAKEAENTADQAELAAIHASNLMDELPFKIDQAKQLRLDLDNADPSSYEGIYNGLFAHVTADVAPDEYSTPQQYKEIRMRRASVKKYYLLCVMSARYAEYLAGLRPLDDRDNWENKQITPPGKTLEKRFWLLWRDTILGNIRKGIKSMSRPTIDHVRRFINHGEMTSKLSSSFTSNEWSTRAGKEYNKESISVDVDRDSLIALYSHMTKINTPTNRQAKQRIIRMVKNSQLGFVCPAETSEGAQCGLVKHKTVGCWISQDRPTEIVKEALEHPSDGKVKLSLTWNKTFSYACLHDGDFIGWCEGEPTRKYLVSLKRSDHLKRDTCIAIDGMILYIYSNAARPTRPLLVVESNGKTVMDNKNLWGEPFEELLRQGAVEYLDAWEQNRVTVAQTLGDLEPDTVDYVSTIASLKEDLNRLQKGETVVRMSQSTVDGFRMARKVDVTEEYLQNEIASAESSMLKVLTKYQYCELDPNAILGVSASIIPFPDHNPAPRNTYQCHMAGQSLGTYHSNQAERFDTAAKTLIAPRPPLFKTQMNDLIGLRELPAGDMVRCMIGVYLGYNQEDGLIINKASLERGLFRMMIRRKHMATLRIDTKHGISEEFGIPPPRRGHPPGAYSHLDENGVARVGSVLKLGHCIIGKIRKKIIPGRKDPKIEDASVYVERGGEGIVDRVIPPTTLPNGDVVVKVMVRDIRPPVEGDKFACLTPEHQVLTSNRGWIGIADLTTEDSVATLNSDEHLEYQKPSDVHSYDYSGKMYSLSSQQVDLITTPRHRMWVKKENRTNYEFVNAEDVVGDNVLYCRSDDNGDLVAVEVDKKVEKWVDYTGKVHCCTVPNGIFYVRLNGKPVWSGNSRHAQKSVAGLIVPEEDMPYDSQGSRPDVIINPHAIPSRMTIGKLIEIVASKHIVMSGESIDATAFRNFNVDDFKSTLYQYGYRRGGKVTMYNGITGKPFRVPIFIGPCYYQALKHHAIDKVSARGQGPNDPITRQPVGGRKRLGGTRLGEMERDALISHGAANVLHERMCLSSDRYSAVFCATCGRIAISRVDIEGSNRQTTNVCKRCKDNARFTTCEIPYAFKALVQTLEGTGMEIKAKLVEETDEERTSRLINETGIMS